MEDYSIIQGQSVLEVMFVLLLTLVTSYVYISCKLHAQHTDAAHTARLKTLRRCSPEDNPQPFSAEPELPKKLGPSVLDWIPPLVVWSAVGWVALAVACILLGEN